MKNRIVGADSISAQKGITLVALVITIIVLLILAGITINLTLGEHGILNMAKEAGKNYQNAAQQEQEEIGNLFNEAQNVINGEENGAPDNPNENEQPEKIVELSDLKAGDYVVGKSMSNTFFNGRVLYPLSSEYGLQLISSYKTGYINSPFEWADAAALYNDPAGFLKSAVCGSYNKYMFSDCRCVGSSPEVVDGKFVQGTDTTGDYLVGSTDLYPRYVRPEGWESDETGCLASGDSHYVSDVAALTDIGDYETSYSYVLGSRCDPYFDEKTGEFKFTIRTYRYKWDSGPDNFICCYMYTDNSGSNKRLGVYE